jgi:hypothetical protein
VVTTAQDIDPIFLLDLHPPIQGIPEYFPSANIVDEPEQYVFRSPRISRSPRSWNDKSRHVEPMYTFARAINATWKNVCGHMLYDSFFYSFSEPCRCRNREPKMVSNLRLNFLECSLGTSGFCLLLKHRSVTDLLFEIVHYVWIVELREDE